MVHRSGNRAARARGSGGVDLFPVDAPFLCWWSWDRRKGGPSKFPSLPSLKWSALKRRGLSGIGGRIGPRGKLKVTDVKIDGETDTQSAASVRDQCRLLW